MVGFQQHGSKCLILQLIEYFKWVTNQLPNYTKSFNWQRNLSIVGALGSASSAPKIVQFLCRWNNFT